MKFFDRKAFFAAAIGALVLVAAIFAGSRGFRYFDTALTSYAFASVFAMFAVVYRYAVWAQRPPTWIFLKRGWQLFWEKGPAALKRARPVAAPIALSILAPATAPVPMAKIETASRRDAGVPALGVVRNAFSLVRALLENFFVQKFIGKRSYERWIMHACLSWGGMLAFALTFPLVFGWVHFQTLPNDAETFQVLVFGFALDQFNVHSLKGWFAFNLLNISAVIMLIGLALSVKRRMSDAGDMAVQTFGDDIFPIFLLFTVAATGLMLTVSARYMAGRGFGFIAIAHAASVIAMLLYLPFGKLFHIFQRTASLGVSFYKKAGDAGTRAHCLRCNEEFASQMHVDDLKTVLDQVGFDYRYESNSKLKIQNSKLTATNGNGDEGAEIHYQDICPACRRKLLALNQGARLNR